LIYSPFGKLSPGTTPLDIVFKDIWREAESSNREKWGCKFFHIFPLLLQSHVSPLGGRWLFLTCTDLGRTATLADTSDDIGTTTVWLSYWRDIEGLRAFATSTAHMVAHTGWEQGKYPYVGIMHETYHAPKGHHESIYFNFRRWGQGKYLSRWFLPFILEAKDRRC
jgi:hypothetical protein